jgi:predicted amidohydrolase
MISFKRRISLSVILTALAIILPLTASEAEKPTSVKVAAIQCSSDLGAVEKNRTKLSSLVDEAAAKGAKIVVLPETAITGYLSQDLKVNWQVKGRPIESCFTGKDPAGFAETIPGPSSRLFCEQAKRLGIYLTIPLLEVDHSDKSTPRYFNTVCLASPEGKIVAHYRKLTPWPHPEKSWATAGDRGVAVYETEYGKVGLAICFDIHSILEKYQPHDLWALLYPIAWVDFNHPAEWFWHGLPAKLERFPHYVIGANWSVDVKQSWRGYGFSTIYAPGGKVLSSSHSLYSSDIIYADLRTVKANAEDRDLKQAP